MTHTGLLFGLAILYASFSGFLLVFTAEKKFSEEKKQTFFQIFKLLPKFFSKPKLRGLLFYVFLTRVSGGFYGEAMTLQFLNHGIDRTTLVNISTVLTPFSIIANCFGNRFLQKGKLIQYYHKIKFYGWAINLLNFFLFIYLVNSKNTGVTTWLILVLGVFGIVAD